MHRIPVEQIPFPMENSLNNAFLLNSNNSMANHNYMNNSPQSASSSTSTMSASSTTSPSSSSMYSSRPCAVCLGQSNGFYCGVLVCRACASFFRRSAIKKRKYQCRKGEQCAIQSAGMRNSCRACRFRICIAAGMTIDPPETPASGTSSTFSPCPPEIVHIQQQQPSAIVNFSNSTKLNIKTTFDLSIPFSLQLSQSLKNLRNGHRALVNVLFGKMDLPFDEEKQVFNERLITLEQHINLNRGQITLTMMFLREYYPHLEKLDNETKVHLLKNFYMQFVLFRNAEYTIKAYPDAHKYDKYVMHPDCVMDRNNLRHFFSTCEPSSIDEHIRICIPMFDQISSHIDKQRPLAIDQLEFAALTGILLYTCVNRFVPLPYEFTARRNQLYSELHTILTQRHGGNMELVAIRFGQLLTLLIELGNLTYEFDELLTILKIFMPGGDIWEDMLNAKPKICESLSQTENPPPATREESKNDQNIGSRKSSATTAESAETTHSLMVDVESQN